MADASIRTVQCAYCLRQSVNVTYEAGLDDDRNRVECELERAPCKTAGCIGPRMTPSPDWGYVMAIPGTATTCPFSRIVKY